ncbi:MAG: outer membrane beta-barrel domain-containing protein [Betaproteobacteria bacterium]
MKILTLMMALLAAIFVLSESPAPAQINPGSVSISPFFGGYTFDSDLHLETKPVYGLRLGYDITRRWGMEVAADYVSTELEHGGGNVRSLGYRLDALYHFMPDNKLVPFIAAGFGGTTLRNPDGMKDETDSLFNYGAGIKYFLTDALALRADIRHLLVFDGGRNDFEYTLGLSFLFGGKAAAAAPPQPEPAVLDSDGDGVPDNLDKCPDTPKEVKVDKAGCPLDGDGDGVPDYLDKCPDTPKGVKVDKDGCPLDSDGDGVPDYMDKCPDTPKGVKVDKDGCPIPEKKAEKVSISLAVEFDTGKAEIKPQYREQIKKVADFMRKYPETTAVIEGHTDNVGKEDSNVRLSEKRAESVRTYLIENFGIEANRLTARGYGSSRPIADNATPEGRQKNRRIEAVIETTVMR